jgi:hypothetical protein
MSAPACSTVAGSSCARKVFPAAVVKSVREQVKFFESNPPIPPRMELSESMKAANLSDATVRSVCERTSTE